MSLNLFSSSLLAVGRLWFHEIVHASFVNQLWVQLVGNALVLAQGDNSLENIPGMYRLKLTPGFVVPFLQQVDEGVFVERNAELLALSGEQAIEQLLVGPGDLNLYLDAAQESVVDQIFGIEVGGKTISCLKGSWNVWPVCSRKKSIWVSSGTIQRLSRSVGRIC